MQTQLSEMKGQRSDMNLRALEQERTQDLGHSFSLPAGK